MSLQILWEKANRGRFVLYGLCSASDAPQINSGQMSPDFEMYLRTAERARAWRLRNPDKVKAQYERRFAARTDEERARRAALERARMTDKTRHRIRAWKAANKARRNEMTRAQRAENPEVFRLLEKRRRDKNPGLDVARVARRRAARLRATPAWVDQDAIEAVYELAAFMGLTVDHIEPLQGANSCGLHVPWNLQLMSFRENSAKGNKLVVNDVFA